MDRRRRLVGRLVGLSGVGSLALAALSLGGSLIAAPAESTLEQIRAHEHVDPIAIVDALTRSQQATSLIPDSRYHTGSALAVSALGADGLRFGISHRQRIEIVEAALKRAPVSPHNWMRLALLLHESGDLDSSRKAWDMSVRVGRFVPNLMETRIDLGLQLLNGPDEQFLDDLADQIRLFAHHAPARLAITAKRRNAVPLVRVAVYQSADLGTARKFERQIDALALNK